MPRIKGWKRDRANDSIWYHYDEKFKSVEPLEICQFPMMSSFTNEKGEEGIFVYYAGYRISDRMKSYKDAKNFALKFMRGFDPVSWVKSKKSKVRTLL